MSKQPSHFLISRWTKGEHVEKSLRKTSQNNGNHQQQPQEDDKEINLGGGNIEQSSSGFTRQANKRDSFNQMLSNRDMHTQVGQNPFLAGESYLKHLKIQEDFLRPQNTNMLISNTNG